MSNYLLSISNCEAIKDGTIHDTRSKLKVNVFKALLPIFKPSKGEVSFFVTAENETLAFETNGFNKHQQILILHMISWYCVYSGLTKAQIHSKLPFNYN